MTRIRSRSLGRRGFTLIELLVVIAIIAILVSLTAAGVMRVLWKIPEIQTRTEISQFDVALASFMSDYNLSDPPPSALILREDMAYNLTPQGSPGYNPLEVRSYQFLKRTFGKNFGTSIVNGTPVIGVDWNQNGVIDSSGGFVPPYGAGYSLLEGEQCLIFYTGGLQTVVGGTPQCLGFSTNNNKPSYGSMPLPPFNEVMGRRNGPYMQFNTGRLMLGNAFNANLSSWFVYIDAWQVKPYPQVYAYFSTYGINNGYTADCPTILATPYSDGLGHFTNTNKYQIISAGQDGLFGNGVWNASQGATGTGKDDQANFSAKILGAGQQ